MGLLAAIGTLFPNSDGSQNGLQRFDNAFDPVSAYYQQQAVEKQQENETNAATLKALADAGQQGITNPSQLFGKVAAVNPGYLKDYASMASSNPLGFALQGGGGGQQTASPIAGLTGDDLLKALPPQIASTVKAYGENRLPWNPRLSATPQGQTMASLITQAYPDFDAADQPAKVAMRKSFISGPDSENVKALNTAMGHAAALKGAYDKLDNGDYPILNKMKNATEIALGDTDKQTATSDVAAKGHALSGELAKVFRSTGMAEADIKAWEDKLDTNATPAQSKATLAAAMDLMDSRLDALKEKYNQGYRSSKQGIELLSPEAQKAYYKVRGEAPKSGGTADGANPTPDATPSPLAHLSNDELLAIARKK